MNIEKRRNIDGRSDGLCLSYSGLEKFPVCVSKYVNRIYYCEIPLALVLALGSFVMSGCQTTADVREDGHPNPNWNVRTSYIVEDVGETADEVPLAARMEDALKEIQEENIARNGAVESTLYPNILVHEADGVVRFQFNEREIRTMRDLAEIQSTIERVSRDANVPVRLTGAQLEFASTRGRGTIETNVRIYGEGAIGGRVEIDLRTGELYSVRIDDEGHWGYAWNFGNVPGYEGYAYLRFTDAEGEIDLYQTMNLFTGDSRNIGVEDLPSDSILNDGGADTGQPADP